MSAIYQVRPVTDFTIFTTPPNRRKGVQFKAAWSQTLNDLGRELDYLDASDVVLELDVRPDRIRRDGMLYADAKVGHPGVRISFQSKHGDLSYTCDTYEARYYGQMPDWQANVRAIVLTLESLRAVDRYGATKGEQYAGFKALPSGSGSTPLGGMTHDDAWAILRSFSDQPVMESRNDPNCHRQLLRKAKAFAHPDKHAGDRHLWDQVEQAAKVLGLL